MVIFRKAGFEIIQIVQFGTHPESPKRIESRDNDLLALLLKRVQIDTVDDISTPK